MENFKLFLCVCIDDGVRCVYSLTSDTLKVCEEMQQCIPPILSSFSTNPPSIHNLVVDTVTSTSYIFDSFRTNILMIKPFLEELKTSKCYRNLVFDNFKGRVNKYKNNSSFTDPVDEYRCFVVIEADLVKSYAIDYAWGWRLWRECHIGLERECAAAWLSTLGGAFSALGDSSSRFANMALHTSLQQLKLARLSQDDNGIARGWLFLALALSQLGHHRYAGILLQCAWKHPSYDPRHRNMCLGVQAKLRYDLKIRRLMKPEERSMLIWKRNNLWESLKTLTI